MSRCRSCRAFLTPSRRWLREDVVTKLALAADTQHTYVQCNNEQRHITIPIIRGDLYISHKSGFDTFL